MTSDPTTHAGVDQWLNLSIWKNSSVPIALKLVKIHPRVSFPMTMIALLSLIDV